MEIRLDPAQRPTLWKANPGIRMPAVLLPPPSIQLKWEESEPLYVNRPSPPLQIVRKYFVSAADHSQQYKTELTES